MVLFSTAIAIKKIHDNKEEIYFTIKHVLPRSYLLLSKSRIFTTF